MAVTNTRSQALIRKRQPEIRSPQKEIRASWSDENEIELLAWLNYTVLRNDKGTHFKDTILNHLHMMCNKEYTLFQVDRKVRSYWQDLGPEGAKDRDQIYKEGTHCLHYPLRRDLRENLKFKKMLDARVKKLKEEAAWSSRNLRSVSRMTEPENLHHFSLGTESPRRSVLYRERAQLHSPCSTLAISRLRRKGSNNKVQSSAGPVVHRPKQAAKDEPVKRRLFDQDIVADSEGQLSDSDEYQGSKISSLGRHKKKIRSDAFSVVGVTPSSLDDKSALDTNTSVAQRQGSMPLTYRMSGSWITNSHSQVLPGDIESELSYHRDQASRAKQENEELRKLVTRLDAELSTHSGSSDFEISKRVGAQQEEIYDLNKQLANKKWLRAFSTLKPTKCIRLDPQYVEVEMALIHNDIKQVLHDYEAPGAVTLRSLEEQSELKALLCRFLIFDPADSVPVDLSCLDALTFPALLRSLITAALCAWVFESMLEEVCVKPCALLEKYRLHLGSQDGDAALRNLDLAAHQALIDEKVFQEYVIPRRANILVARLLHTLSPLFSPGKGLRGASMDGLRRWTQERQFLEQIVARALRLKAKSLIATDLFEFVHYAPGTPFHGDSMIAETMDGDHMDLPPRSSRRVQLCVLPALHAHEQSRNTVEYHNFVKNHVNEGTRSRRLTKAVVVVEDHDLSQPVDLGRDRRSSGFKDVDR